MKETKFKQTEVGMIPSDWEVCPLNFFADILNGDRGVNYPKDSDFCDAGIPFINAGHLKKCQIDFSCMDYITYEHYKKLGGAKIKKNDILFCLRGSLGKYAYVNFDDAAPASSLCVLRSKKIDPKYLFQLLGFEYIKTQIIDANSGSSQPNLSAKDVGNFNVIFPPKIEEQQRIANVLSDVDTLIANLEKLIAKKKNIKQGAMQQLLTGKKRLPGFGGKWNKKVISKLGYTYNGLSGKIASDFGKGSAQYITFLNVLNNPVVDKHLFQKVNVSEAENQNKVLKDDLLFNTSSEVPEEVGICSVLKAEVPNLYLNSFCFGFRLTDTAVDGLFLSYYFRSPLGRSLMSLLAQGSTRYNLSKDNFLKSSIVIPSSKTEQTAIANVLSDMDTEISALETKLAKYRTLKTGMMQQLLTGKIRLV